MYVHTHMCMHTYAHVYAYIHMDVYLLFNTGVHATSSMSCCCHGIDHTCMYVHANTQTNDRASSRRLSITHAKNKHHRHDKHTHPFRMWPRLAPSCLKNPSRGNFLGVGDVTYSAENLVVRVKHLFEDADRGEASDLVFRGKRVVLLVITVHLGQDDACMHVDFDHSPGSTSSACDSFRSLPNFDVGRRHGRQEGTRSRNPHREIFCATDHPF
jgi:hypothetical protein